MSLPKFKTHAEAWAVFMTRYPVPEDTSRTIHGLFLAGYAAGISAAVNVIGESYLAGKRTLEDDLDDVVKTLEGIL